MKLLCLLFLAAFTLAAPAADVVIQDDGTITKDGVSLNNAWDALLNKQVTNAEFAAAWRAKMKEIETKSAAADKAKADAETKANAAIIEVKKRKAAEGATGKGKKWEALDELEGALNVTADDVRVRDLDAQIEALKAERAKIRK